LKAISLIAYEPFAVATELTSRAIRDPIYFDTLICTRKFSFSMVCGTKFNEYAQCCRIG